ncbi:MAG: hypothetical protein U0521_15510 [Anaerolineae bacterium]
MAVVFMFRVNGQAVVWTQDEAVTMILRAAEGAAGLSELAAWFPLMNARMPTSRTPTATPA